jgi:hypothetical protein
LNFPHLFARRVAPTASSVITAVRPDYAHRDQEA